jgi:hypothetical protein
VSNWLWPVLEILADFLFNLALSSTNLDVEHLINSVIYHTSGSMVPQGHDTLLQLIGLCGGTFGMVQRFGSFVESLPYRTGRFKCFAPNVSSIALLNCFE